MSSRTCPDWPKLMELAPELQFKHYTLREVQLPADALVSLERVDFDDGRDLLRSRQPRLQPRAHRARRSRTRSAPRTGSTCASGPRARRGRRPRRPAPARSPATRPVAVVSPAGCRR